MVIITIITIIIIKLIITTIKVITKIIANKIKISNINNKTMIRIIIIMTH